MYAPTYRSPCKPESTEGRPWGQPLKKLVWCIRSSVVNKWVLYANPFLRFEQESGFLSFREPSNNVMNYGYWTLAACLSIDLWSLRLSRMRPVGAASSPRAHKFRAVANRRLGVQYTRAVALWADRKSLSRLWPVQMSSHSRFTRSKPRSRNCRNPRLSLICPNTGSIRNA